MFIQHWSQSSNQEDSIFVPSHSQRSQIWHPHLLKKIQHHAIKYILNDIISDYRSRLIALKILPLMMQLELYDVMFFIRSVKGPTDAFKIYDHVTFHTVCTRCTETCFVKNELCKTFLLQQNA